MYRVVCPGDYDAATRSVADFAVVAADSDADADADASSGRSGSSGRVVVLRYHETRGGRDYEVRMLREVARAAAHAGSGGSTNNARGRRAGRHDDDADDDDGVLLPVVLDTLDR